MTPAVLETRHVGKSFPGVKALSDVSIDLRAGEVHALVGENGAGKSTLISILTGAQKPDDGAVLLDGEPANFGSPAAARRAGVGAIYQELALVPWLTVAENIRLGDEPRRMGIVKTSRMRSEARGALHSLGVDVDVTAPTASLRTAERQLVEVARALSTSARVLIMDEPTSSLPASDAERLLAVVRRLRDEGAALLFVSHRLEEVLAVADRITVLRGGRVMTTVAVDAIDSDALIELMVGSSLGRLFPQRTTAARGDVVLEVDRLRPRGAEHEVSFQVRAGEVVGFAGLVGAGRTEAMRAVCGIDPPDAGRVVVAGTARTFKTPREAMRAGVVYVPEDRKDDGLVLGLSGYDNVALPTLRRFARFGLLRGRRLRRGVEAVTARFAVRGRLDRPARTLSGGNQQKLVLAKWVFAGARVLVLDEPTRGIDIGAKREVYELVRELCDEGLAVVLVSSELAELVHLADRIVVMSGGRVTDVVERGEFDEQRILRAAFAAHVVRHVEDAA